MTRAGRRPRAARAAGPADRLRVRGPREAPADPERRQLAAARRLISLRIAAVLTVVMLVVGGAVYTVMAAAQHASIDRNLRYAAERSGLASPPGCAWLIVERAGRAERSPGTPAGFPLAGPLAAVAAGGPPRTDSVRLAGEPYRVLTTRRPGGEVVQAVYDDRFEQQDLRALLLALGVTEALGLAGAAVAGGVLAHRAIRPLGEALLRRRRFVADASHELRTPVTRVHIRAQLLARRAYGEPADAEVARLVAATGQLGDVIEDLLLSTQVRAGPALFAAVDLALVADRTVADEAERAGEAGLAVGVVRERGPYVVAGVETALRRVVTALVDNAVGHTPPGGRITVTVGSAPGGTVRLTVRDTGVGFDPDDADRLFERFARGAGGSGPRFGIGLSLVREVVDSHHGTVEAAGTPGAGALFTVTLPAWRAGRARRGRQSALRAPARRSTAG